MIQRIVSLIFLLSLLCLTPAIAQQKVLALQSVTIAPYEEAIRGFELASGVPVRRFVISDLHAKEVIREVLEARPDMVLAVGRDALLVARRIKNIPVVYCMVLNPLALLTSEVNISGVSMNLTPERQLRDILQTLPGQHKISLLYNPEATGGFVEELRKAAAKHGVHLAATPVRRAQEVPRLLNGMRGKIDLFWMLPDITVVTPETVEAILLFSLENHTPVLTFSEKYLENGAMLSIGIDPFDIGRQAGEMAQMIFSGREPVKHVEARKAAITVNQKIAEKLGVRVETRMLRNDGGGR